MPTYTLYVTARYQVEAKTAEQALISYRIQYENIELSEAQRLFDFNPEDLLDDFELLESNTDVYEGGEE